MGEFGGLEEIRRCGVPMRWVGSEETHAKRCRGEDLGDAAEGEEVGEVLLEAGVLKGRVRVGYDGVEGLEGLRVDDQTRDAQKSRKRVACGT
jgi:hypothetical protein